MDVRGANISEKEVSLEEKAGEDSKLYNLKQGEGK